jgi:hypothetical protein
MQRVDTPSLARVQLLGLSDALAGLTLARESEDTPLWELRGRLLLCAAPLWSFLFLWPTRFYRPHLVEILGVGLIGMLVLAELAMLLGYRERMQRGVIRTGVLLKFVTDTQFVQSIYAAVPPLWHWLLLGPRPQRMDEAYRLLAANLDWFIAPTPRLVRLRWVLTGAGLASFLCFMVLRAWELEPRLGLLAAGATALWAAWFDARFARRCNCLALYRYIEYRLE